MHSTKNEPLFHIDLSRQRWCPVFCVFLGLASPVFTLAARPHDDETDTQQPALGQSPWVITAVQQSAPLAVITSRRDACQSVPAGDGNDYLKTIPGFWAIRSGGFNGDSVMRGMFGSRLNLRTNGGLMLGNRIDEERHADAAGTEPDKRVLWGIFGIFLDADLYRSPTQCRAWAELQVLNTLNK
uniref:hypothetical protein n=1 Tax=Pseudomonas sp. G.S.17 TaxID=3137451 RepID=UPI004053D305